VALEKKGAIPRGTWEPAPLGQALGFLEDCFLRLKAHDFITAHLAYFVEEESR